jgi:transcriptional regulator with XRE-family HTH domain
MTVRKKARRKSASAGGRKKVVRRRKTSSKKSKKKSTQRGRTASRKRPQKTVRTRAASLADRLTELVEHAAAGALRLAVDTGGREIAAWLPEASEVRHEAGDYMRELRELAGMTVDELADAIELRDQSLLEAVEAGTASLSFELILRLAAILARHDPIPFVSRMVRSYNPVLWQLLEDWGIGRLPAQLEREHQFVNILRSRDEARELSDKDFERVLEFTRSAFETGLHFAVKPARVRSSKGKRPGPER